MDKYVINVDQLAACYQRRDVLVIDCRYSLSDTCQGETLYRQSHIPGSHYLHLDRELFRGALAQRAGMAAGIRCRKYRSWKLCSAVSGLMPVAM